MATHLLATLLLVILPLWLLAMRRGWLERTAARFALGGLSLALVAASAPWQGVELDATRRLCLLISAATLLTLFLRREGDRPRRIPPGVLPVLAGAAILVQINFFAFHGVGTRVFVHQHDVAHYYLGAKYFGEVGYGGLYTAMLRAEAERYDDRLLTLEARDLTTDRIVHVRSLLERSAPLRASFTDQRWRDFERDVGAVRERLGAEGSKRFYLDRGFNATPLWALLGGALANAVPAGSERGILLLTLIDPLLLLIMLGAIGWAFGRETLLLATIYLAIAYGATFGWTGGAFLRYGWLVCLVGGFACLERRRAVSAGVLFAFAVSLRIFPALFLAGLAATAGDALIRRRVLPADIRRTIAAGLVAGLVLALLTGFLPQGFAAWQDFRANSELYLGVLAPNLVGLTPLLAFTGRPGTVSLETLEAIKLRRVGIYRWQLGLLFVPIAVLVVLGFARRPLLEAMTGGGLILAFTGFNLAAYYWVFLLLLLLVHRRRPRVALLLFALETAVYVLALFESHEGMLFHYKSVLVLYLLLALYLSPVSTARLAAGP